MKHLGLAAVAAILIASVIWPYWIASSLIARVAGAEGALGQAARWTASEVRQSIERVPVRSGAIRARVYKAAGARLGSALLVSGVHREGIDEPRLMRLASELAATGITVATPEIDDLVRYRLTSQVTDTIEDAAVWMLARPDVFGNERIGVIGVSFSGGLGIVAAGRPTLRDRVAYVVSFGGHGNLPRVLRYLCTGEGSPQKPHDYALAVVLHQAADLVVPAGQSALLRAQLETFLAEAQALQSRAEEPLATILTQVNNRDVRAIGAWIAPYLDKLGQDSSLSPDRSPAPGAPVYLLHGADDNVIPARESELLAEHLRGKTAVRRLVSGFLTHVDVAARPSTKDKWEMIAFWKDILAEHQSFGIQ
jgi:dienelactone hydrolase